MKPHYRLTGSFTWWAACAARNKQMIHDMSLGRRLFYRYLGLAYGFTYWTSHKTFLGATWQGWIKFLVIVLLLASLIFRWGVWETGGTAVLLVWIYFSYWRAKKAGYSKFILSETEHLLPGEGLPPYQRTTVWATGVYHVTEFNKFLLLRPAEYWQVPLGQHVVMVEHRRQKFLYQFFDWRTLQQVEAGWLIFGARPLATLAVTFISAWLEDGKDPETRTIYLSFPEVETQTAVWRTIIRDVGRNQPHEIA
ncbi:MAG: hypothetical protein KC441_05995 [Anaerolineales bacterium]|nr:hypothetical protein [Anaerolineales bacterium]